MSILRDSDGWIFSDRLCRETTVLSRETRQDRRRFAEIEINRSTFSGNDISLFHVMPPTLSSETNYYRGGERAMFRRTCLLHVAQRRFPNNSRGRGIRDSNSVASVWVVFDFRLVIGRERSDSRYSLRISKVKTIYSNERGASWKRIRCSLYAVRATRTRFVRTFIERSRENCLFCF